MEWDWLGLTPHRRVDGLTDRQTLSMLLTWATHVQALSDLPGTLQPFLGQGWVAQSSRCHCPLTVTGPDCSVAASNPSGCFEIGK